jgi:hypothetical protein
MRTGAARIILTGYDGGTDQLGRYHWYNAPDWQQINQLYANEADAPIAEAARSRGIQIVNCSPGTLVKTFPTARLEDVLRRCAA